MKHIALSEGIVSLGNGCFWNSQHLESIRLPQSLVWMGNDCFNNCLALNSITIPENVAQIGQSAFLYCPFTDIYLTTTDPNHLPAVWSCGTEFTSYDNKSTFHHGHLDGYDGGIDGTIQAEIDGQMTFDEAVALYYINWNGMPVLHYPSELAEKVRASISATYALTSSDGYGLPNRDDMPKRDNIPGADLGSSGAGKYTTDGWAQFMLMKEFSTSGPTPEVYQKEYDDVWYTMCFPFDLTDEQLASAFNETFNIVDFSGVEVVEAEDNDGESMKLVLHFNNVAVTDYKDTEGKHYKRVMDGSGNAVREKDAASGFDYNVYVDDDNNQYHHVTTSQMLSSNKTKTFAKGGSMDAAQNNFNSTKEAYIIDGVLATAGHPYMIHPAIGVVAGQPKQRCTFAGVDWLGQSKWKKAFIENSRTIDLGIKKTLEELPDSNYNHPGYSEYAGQTYTFIGNPTEYREDAQAAIGDEPQVPDMPKEPVAPTQPTETLPMPTETIAEPEALTADEQNIVTLLIDGQGQYNRGPWYGITTEITANYNDGSSQYQQWAGKFYMLQEALGKLGYGYQDLGGFNFCKNAFNKSINYTNDYAAYQANQAEWNAYNANQAAWDAYNNYDAAVAQAQYQADLAAYNAAAAEHAAWVSNADKWKTYIPMHAYFLGRRPGELPKYYREMAADPAAGQPSTRSGGIWTQFAAIVIPNSDAINGIEKGISNKQAGSKGFDMLFNEDFDGTYIDQDDEDVITAIENAKKEGADVKYVDIVVSINGQVVRRGSTSLEGLPKGMYIINGKKYFVK